MVRRISNWVLKHWVEIILFVLFAVANTAYLNRVPGLMGDEAHEGENVFRLLDTKTITFQGERSYIGPLIDYVRIPAVLTFGYSALALRVTTLLFSLVTFVLTLSIAKRLFGRTTGLIAATIMLFSPIYLGEQRMAWAITLNVFFAVLLLWAVIRRSKEMSSLRTPSLSRGVAISSLLIGLIAGIGLQNHILFLPTVVAVLDVAVLAEIIRAAKDGLRPVINRLYSWWPAVIGFWAGFATQAVMLTISKADQGDPGVVAQVFWDRFIALPGALPVLISGSSYAARYTGVELPLFLSWLITIIIFCLILAALLLTKQKKMVWVWLVGLLINLGVLLFVIDRFNLRYFVVFVLGIWVLAGVGLGEILRRIFKKYYSQWISLVVAIILILVSIVIILLPFLRTGGSLNSFSLGNRTDSAAALVDIKSLLGCVRGIGPVTSENVHIFNRLNFLSHQYLDLIVIDPDHIGATKPQWVINYRDTNNQESGYCPDLKFFVVKPI